jgi:FKBP-type peptidyl-prolyl cis-trans isomerase FklB
MTNRVPPALATPPKMPDKDKLSYALGMDFGSWIKRNKIEVDIETTTTAMKDMLAGRPTRMTEDEVKTTMRDFQGAMRAKMAADREKEAAENKAKGDEYLDKNAKAEGVKTLPNGLQYKVLTEGDGPMPKTNDTVTVSYKGRLIDGTVFDQNEHFTTPVTGRTVKGWSEILPLMKTGAKWEVTIPPQLGYGPRGMPPKIGPNTVLIFEMGLLSIAPPAKPAPPPATAPPAAAHGTNGMPPSPPGISTPVVSGQIIKVPSAEGLKKGEKIEVITNAPGQ